MGSAGRQVHSMGWVADAFGNALGNSIVGAMTSSGSGLDQEAEAQMRRGMAEEEAGRARRPSAGDPVSLPPHFGSYNSDDEMAPPQGFAFGDPDAPAALQNIVTTEGDTHYVGYNERGAVAVSAGRVDAVESAINGLGVGIAQAEWSAITGTISTARTLAGAGLDLIARPLGVDAYAPHTEALRTGLGDFADFVGNDPLGQIAQATRNYVDATQSAFQSGNSYEAFRLVGRGVGEAALLGVGAVGGVGRAGLREVSSLSRLDYSSTFANDLRNFNPDYNHFSGALGDDLLLVQFHRSDRALGQGRSAAWWTTPDQANQFFTVDDVRQGLALPTGWGPRDAVSIARIPAGAQVEFFQGTALRQMENNMLFNGDGVQYRFRDFDPNWIVETRRIPGASQ